MRRSLDSTARIQDLGSGLWRDGVAQGYFRNEPPTRHAYAYPRDVDYVAGCFFCVSTADFRELKGLTRLFASCYGRIRPIDANSLQSRARDRAYIQKSEFITIRIRGVFGGPSARVCRFNRGENRPIFVARHRKALDLRPIYKPHGDYAIRYKDIRPRLLFVEDRLPSSSLGSGFGRSTSIIKTLLNFADVDVFACYRHESDATSNDFRYIEVVYGPDPELLQRRLADRHYDIIYMCSPTI